MEQNRKPRNNPTLSGQLMFGKGGRSIKWSKNSLFNKWCWKICRQLHAKKNETQSPTYAIHKNKFKMDKILKYKSWYHKSPREEHRQKISDISCSNIFTNMSPRARDIKGRINKWDLIKLKSFFMAKENSIKMKRHQTVWGKHICQWYLRQGFHLQNI